MVNKAVLVLSIIILSITMGSLLAVADTGGAWKEYSFISTSIVSYDVDKDGVVELLALPYYMIDNYVQVRSPYAQYEHGMLVDVNLDGVKELVLYNNAGDYLIYNGTTLLKHFNLGAGTPIVDLTGRAIAVGNKVLFNMTVYSFPDAGQVYPVVAGNKLYVVYEAGNKLYLEDTDGNKWEVYNDAIEPLGAILSYNKLYIVGKAPLGGTVFIKYTINGTAQVSGFTTDLVRVIKWIPSDEAFIAEGENNIYRVKFYSLVLENTGTVIGYDDQYIYLYRDGEIVVYNPTTKTTVEKIETPEPRRPDVFGGTYPYMGVVYGNKTYIAVLKPEPVVVLIIPSKLTVGEPTYYRVDAANAEDVTLSVNGTVLPLEGYITVNESGKYVFTVSASNGLITYTKTYIVEAEPRPLVLSIKVLGPAVAYENGRIVVEALDGLNGSKVENIYCKLSVPDNLTLTIMPWKPVNITFIPPSDKELNVPISVTCGDGKYYRKTTYQIDIPVQPNVARIKTDYLSNGKIRISFVSLRGNQTVPGEVNVYLDGEFVSHGDVPYILSGLTPGNHTIIVEFVPRLQAYKPAKYTLKLTYYENVSEVPSEVLSTVQIADRVKVINNTVVKTETVTVPKPVYVERKVVDTFMSLYLFAIGLVGGGVTGFVIRHITYGRGKKGKKPGVEEELEEYEVEVEKT